MSINKTAAVLAYTQDMMLAAIEEHWDELREMQLNQDAMLQALFSVADVILSEAEQEELFEVQRLNQEILAAAEAYKGDIAMELREMRQGKAKASAYQAL